jgi:hypothetical protein
MKHACVDASDNRAFVGRNQTSSVGDAGGGDREVQLRKLVDRKLQDIQNAQLKISVNGKEVVVREQIRKVVHTILSAKDFIGPAISVEPHSALVWAGVLAVLLAGISITNTFYFLMLTSASQLFLNPITQDEDAVEGLGYISDLLIRRKVIADTYLETCILASTIPVQRYLISFIRTLRALSETKPSFALSAH